MRYFFTAILFFQFLLCFAQQTCLDEVYTNGYATYYNLLENGSSNVVRCSFDAVNDIKGTKYGALHHTMYNQVPASYCGACVEMTGAAGTDTIQLVDECPTCEKSSEDIDLSPDAFEAIVGDLTIGLDQITWREVSCPWTTPIHLIVQGSNQWYTKVIIGNHVNRISKVEVKQGDAWYTLTREADNGWVSSGVVTNEVSKSFRVTDIYNQQIEISGVDFSNDPTNTKVYGTSNFEKCGLVNIIETQFNSHRIVAFPNPTNESITFDGLEEATQIDITDITGKVVISKVLSNNPSSTTIATEVLISGVYTAQVIAKQGVFSVKFVKK